MARSSVTATLKHTAIVWYAYLSRHNVITLIVVVGGLLLFGACSMLLCEEENIQGWGEAIWYSLVTMTTVGYGDLYPATFAGRLVGAVMMIVGVGVLGMLSGTFATMLVERNRKEDDGLSQVTVKNHLIVCGWNSRAAGVVRELLAGLADGTHLVIIADLESKPIDDEMIILVRGDATDETVLRRANIEHAASALILSGASEGSGADAPGILTVLTIESINSEVYTCIELQDASNVQHCKRANADEILVSGQLNAKLLANSFLYHGASQVLTELVSGSSGNDFTKIRLPESLVGKSFAECLQVMHKNDRTILIGVETDGQRMVNPESHTMRSGDQVFVIKSGNQVS